MAETKARSAGELGAFDIGCVVVGGIIGVGIFFTPGRVAAAVDSPQQAMVAWALGGVLAVMGALVFARLARRMPDHGGTFVYLHTAFGPLPAFLYGWGNWLVIQAGAAGVIGLVMASYLEVVLFGEHDVLPPAGRVAVAATAIVAFTLINALGLRVGKRVQNALTIIKVAAVLVLVGLALLVRFVDAAAPAPVAVAEAAAESAAARGWLAGLAAAILPVLFSFGGWQQGSFVAGAARRPSRDVPLGIFFGVTVVVVVYLLVNLAFLDLLGHRGTAQSSTVAQDATAAALAPWGIGDLAGRLISAAVVISALGILNTICLAPPYVLHAMARRGLFFETVGRLHARTQAPVVGVLVQGLWGAALLVGTYALSGAGTLHALDFLLNGIVFVDWLFYAGCGLALWRTARGGVGLLFAGCALAVSAAAVLRFPLSSAWGLALCALGLPVYAWLVRRGGRS